MEEEIKKDSQKKVDQEWKEKVSQEKRVHRAPADSAPADSASGESSSEVLPQALPEADFLQFISGLGIQGLIFLGEALNPISGKKEQDLPQAKYIIDTLSVLEEKTRGNLTSPEEKMLEGLLYNLRMKYVALSGPPGGQGEK